jgi:hypothetical protein
MKHSTDAEVKFNIPGWMIEKHPDSMDRAARLAAQLINEEGYSEEQAFQMALEQIQSDGDEPPLDEDLREADFQGTPLE